MRKKLFRFTRGDIVQVSPGLEFASPLSGEDRKEKAVIVYGKLEKFSNKTWKSYLVRSLNDPNRFYTLDEDFIRLARTEDREKDNGKGNK